MGKVKTGIKGFLFLIIIAVIIIGVVLAIILWPQRPEKIKNTLNEQTEIVLSADGEFLENFNNFGEYSLDVRNSNASMENEFNNTLTIYKNLTTYFDFVAYVFNDADFTVYERKDIQTAQNGFNSAKTTINNISKFLKEKNDSLTTESGNTRIYTKTDAELVWKSVKKDIQESFKNYAQATEALAKVYRMNISKGVYANEFADYVVDGIGYYVSYFSKNFEKYGEETYKNMTEYFNNYVQKYIAVNGETRLVASYITSTNLQNMENDLANANSYESYMLQKLIDGNLQFNGDNLTEEQINTLNSCVTFYKGGISK